MKDHSDTHLIGDRIRGLLKTHGITQTDLATRAGIDRADLNRLINNKRQPRTDEVGVLAQAFGLPQVEFVKGVELPEPVAKALAAIEQLEARALEAEQRAAMAESRLASLEAVIEDERDLNARASLDANKAHRAELAQLRSAHNDELVQVRAAHQLELQQTMALVEEQQEENFKALQKLNTENQRLRGRLGQTTGALETIAQQNNSLRQSLAAQSGNATATAILGGLAGLLFGAGIAAAASSD